MSWDTLALRAFISSSASTSMVQAPGNSDVAMYFRWDNMYRHIAVDHYGRPAANPKAIVCIVEAKRAKLRHDGLNILRVASAGYTALPPPIGPDGQLVPPWWGVLGFPAGPTQGEAETKYREFVELNHPEIGGDPGTFNAIASPIDEARGSFGGDKQRVA